MDLITGIKERRSIRKFQDRKVPHEVIEEIVNVAAYAPSWKNTQIARYIVVEDPEKIAAIATEDCTLGFAYNIKTMSNAPALVLLTMVKGRSGFEKDGSYTFKHSGNDDTPWNIYILDEEFTDGMRYLYSNYTPDGVTEFTAYLKAGQYVYFICTENEWTSSEFSDTQAEVYLNTAE